MRTVEDQIKQGITTTLDEPVSETIKRDLNQVKEKLIVVLMPLSHDAQDNVLNKLKDWDLFGPLLVCLLLSTLLSITAPRQRFINNNIYQNIIIINILLLISVHL